MHQLQQAIDQIARIVLGKESQIRLSLTCLLANGHLLLEDLPGMGKTTLAHALSATLGLSFQRVQFTNDLLPADILGFSLFNRDTSQFQFQPGPIFSQVLLADEINRAPPKSQSALLEAMEERQVSIEGQSRPLPQPFFVIATQNPASQIGVFPLPESQLDRFLMRIHLGYPGKEAERAMLTGVDGRSLLAALKPVLSLTELTALQRQLDQIHASPLIIDYLQSLLDYSRSSADFVHGLSPRAGLALLRAARGWALLEQRNYLLPDDIHAVLAAVVDHRLRWSGSERKVQGAGQHLLEQVPVPV